MGRAATSVGKMGRDGGVKATPVDHYRRQIARQDSKKEKKHVKEYKQQQAAKEKTPKAFKDMVRGRLYMTSRNYLYFLTPPSQITPCRKYKSSKISVTNIKPKC